MVPSVKIVEVSPRDGLQNEPVSVPTEVKARFVRNLVDAGLTEIEVTSFVSPKWVPQLADAAELAATLDARAHYSALVPNLKGLESAVSAGIRRIALFTAASETFCQKNINMTQQQSLDGFREVVLQFKNQFPDGHVRAYVSTAFECPYEGRIAPGEVASVTEALFELGAEEVSLGDTIGVAGPSEVRVLCEVMEDAIGLKRLALHFHDTNGLAIANVAEGLSAGIRVFDSSAAGLGGCPYAPGAGGNLATEDLVYFLKREGVEVPVDLEALAGASLEVLGVLGRTPSAKAQLGALARATPDSCAT